MDLSIKTYEEGHVIRPKACLVARGFGQLEGIDYSETFSHVIRFITVRLVLLLVISYNWVIWLGV